MIAAALAPVLAVVTTDPIPIDFPMVSSITFDFFTYAMKDNFGVVRLGFLGSFGHLSGIMDSEDNLSHPPDFYNFNGNDGFSKKLYNSRLFFELNSKNFGNGKSNGV